MGHKKRNSGKQETSSEYSFTVFFEPAAEGGYVVTCPALPGLVTEGDSLAEARKMARDAIRAYLESPQSSRRPRGQGGPSMTGGRNHGIIELDPTGSFVAWQQDVLLRHVERR